VRVAAAFAFTADATPAIFRHAAIFTPLRRHARLRYALAAALRWRVFADAIRALLMLLPLPPCCHMAATRARRQRHYDVTLPLDVTRYAAVIDYCCALPLRRYAAAVFRHAMPRSGGA